MKPRLQIAAQILAAQSQYFTDCEEHLRAKIVSAIMVADMLIDAEKEIKLIKKTQRKNKGEIK